MESAEEKSNIIRSLRKEAGLSRLDIYKRYKIPVNTLSNWERGKHKLPDYVFDYICGKLTEEINQNRRIWALIKIESNHENPNGTYSTGIACYAKGETLSWFYPFQDGRVSSDVFAQIILMVRSGCEIVYE